LRLTTSPSIDVKANAAAAIGNLASKGKYIRCLRFPHD
jgi:hypothetical protein